MFYAERQQLINITNQLKNSFNNIDKSFGVIFMRSFAQKLQEKCNIEYQKAVEIATLMDVKVDITIDSDEDESAVDDLAELFSDAMISIASMMYDDGTIDVQIFHNLAPQFNVSM